MTDRSTATLARDDLDARVRRLAPAAIAAARPRMTAAAEVLGWSLRPGADLMASFVHELPVLSLSALLGVPIDDQRAVFAWVDRAGDDLEAELALDGYGRTLVALRRGAPGADLVSRLVEHEPDDDVTASLIGPLLVAGTTTSRRDLARTLRALTARPDAWDRVAADPGHLDAIVRPISEDEPSFGSHVARELVQVGLVTLTGQLTAVEIVGEPLRLKFRRRPE